MKMLDDVGWRCWRKMLEEDFRWRFEMDMLEGYVVR